MQNDLDFEWDEAKARSNLAKHGVRFEFAALLIRSRQVFTRREGRIRLISARRANAKEKKLYGNRPVSP